MTREAVCRMMPSAAPAVGLTALKATVCVACVYTCRRLREPFATGVWGRKLQVYEAYATNVRGLKRVSMPGGH
jgi:hypothetical protein